MKYNFDEVINRKNTNSMKYDAALKLNKPQDVLPLWIADMDFQAPPGVKQALKEVVVSGLYGYSIVDETYFEAVYAWYKKNFNRVLKREWMIVTPGVVFAMAMAVKALTKEGDSVLIQRPVYYPFTNVIVRNNRNVVSNGLVLKDGKYEIDFEDFEKQIVENKVKLFLFCNPHNPVGRVWIKEEITKLADICVKYQVKIVSDEIHSDFVYEDHQHVTLSDLSKEYEEITITCTAPTKTFNLAGLQISNIWIPNQGIRKNIRNEIRKTGYESPSLTGIVACRAAYESGEEWLSELKVYLKGNLDFLRAYLEKNIPQIKLIEPEGTYLVWLDLRGLSLRKEKMEELILHKAKVWLDEGSIFGEEGSGFQRINIACPRNRLEDALTRMRDAFSELL